MRKYVFIAAILAIAAACGKSEFSEFSEQSAAPSRAAGRAAAETIEIKVTLPEIIKTVDVKASIAENAMGDIEPSWEEGDKILVGGNVFTLVSVEGKTGTFSGTAPAGESFDIVYPASIATGEQVAVQAADGDMSHIGYHASLKGVNSFDDVEFSYGWAAEHGGKFSQMGCLKVELRLPASISEITSIKVHGEEYDEVMEIGVSNGAVAGGCFTAYLSHYGMELEYEKKLSVDVTLVGGEIYRNSFHPGAQTLHAGCVSHLIISRSNWLPKLDGYGTEQNPYLVASAGDLAAIHGWLELNKYTYFRQTKDIDCSSLTSWIPANNQNAAYGIMYDGGNFKIQNFSYAGPSWPSIFGVVHGEVKNLRVEDSSVSLTSNTQGGLVAAWVGNTDNTLQGRLENVHVVNSCVSTSVSTCHLGGIAGCSGSGTIVNCSYDGVVERKNTSASSDNYPVGGILGSARKKVHVSDCRTSGELNSGCRFVCGGIVGGSNNAIEIVRCSNAMKIYSKEGYAGGIIGLASEGGEIRECMNTGEVTSASYMIGGIVGASIADITIIDCCNTGDVSGQHTIGGILGTAPQNTIISNCFVTGSVTSAEYAVGGIVGRALGNQAWNTFDPNVDVNTTISDCIVFSPSIKTTKSGGVDNNKWFSGGAIAGFASPKNTMRNCWRKADMAFNFFTLASLNELSDDADTSPEKPLPYPSGSPKYYRPYDGKAAENNATVSSVAKVIGWSEAVWDLSASVPSLRCFPSVR